MNSKLLFAATIAVSVLSSVAMADEAPLTRAQVKADLAQAIASHTLQRTDYDSASIDTAAASRSRADVAAELASAKAARKALVGPDANRTYNPYGVEVLAHSSLSRTDVKAATVQAATDGTLQRSDDGDAAVQARLAKQHVASAKFGQRVKAAISRSQS